MVKRYKRLKYIFDNSIEVYEYLDGRYGAPGMGRGKKKKATPEQIRKRNQWNKERKARHKLKTWFKENDFLILLTYKREDRPTNMKMAKWHFAKAIRSMRNEYAKRGYELRWMRNIEVGPRWLAYTSGGKSNSRYGFNCEKGVDAWKRELQTSV